MMYYVKMKYVYYNKPFTNEMTANLFLAKILALATNI